MLDVRIGPCRRKVPESWDELTTPQYLAAVATLHAPLSLAERRLRLLRVICPVPRHLLLVLTPVQLAGCFTWTHFLLPLAADPDPDPDRPPEPAPPLGPRRQLLPTLRLPWLRRWRRWFGPQGNLRNLSFAEFIFADTFFLRYHQTRDVAKLDQLVATLYRPAGADAPDGDQRCRFSEHRLDAYARQLRHLPAATKLGVLMWYASCRQQLQDEFPDLFRADGAGESSAPDWGRVLRKLSGGAFGTVDQTAAQPVRMVLAEFEDQVRAADEVRRQPR